MLEAGPYFVTAIRRTDRDGYDAIADGLRRGAREGLQKARLGHLKKAGVGPVKHLAEFRGEAGKELKVGAELKVGEVFEKGQKVKVSGKSRARASRARSSATTPRPREPRLAQRPRARLDRRLGRPGPVSKGIRGPGQMGAGRVTQRGLEIVDVRDDENLLLVRGSVPGPRGTVVEIEEDR